MGIEFLLCNLQYLSIQSTMISKQDQKYMVLAIGFAQKALTEGNYPAGCLVIKDNDIISESYSSVITDEDPTNHGEMNVIRKACQKLGTRDLSGCTLYSTIEPCLMCAKASIYSNITKVVYGAEHKEYERTTFEILKENNIGTNLEVVSGILKKECKKLLEEFYAL